MKKIIGIIAAVAMAASVFAVDFSAATKIGGSLLEFTSATVTYAGTSTSANSFKMFQEANGSNKDASPNISFSISDDKAGASIKLTSAGNWGTSVNIYAQSIWFKPFDMLKITVGSFSTNLNQEHVTWWKGSQSGIGDLGGTLGDYGYALTLTPMEGLEFDVVLSMAEGTWWLEDGSLNELSFKFQYGADFGTINAIFQAKDTFKTLKFGAGYKNTFDPVTLWVNVLGYVSGSEFQDLRIEADASGSSGSFSWEVCVPVDIAIAKGYNFWTGIAGYNANVLVDPVSVGLIAKASYALDPVTIYLQIEDPNLISDAFMMYIKPGVSGSCGLMGWDIGVEATIAAQSAGGADMFAVKINVPVAFTVSF